MNTQKATFIRSAAEPKAFIRDGRHCIAFAGRSNVGKSSLINSLLNRKNFARVGATPGKTVQVNYFLVDGVYFVDLPGYGYAKVSGDERRRWGELMESYFAEGERITLGILIVDARHAPSPDDVTMAQYFLASARPFVIVANKCDKLKKSEIDESVTRIRETLGVSPAIMVFPYSCMNGTGRKDLLSFIEKCI